MRARDHRQPTGRVHCLVRAVMLLAPSSALAQAQWMSNGVPVCVAPDCYGTSPMICSDGAGGALIAWQLDRTGNDQNIYVRRVLNNGALAPGWPSIGTIATAAPGNQYLRDMVPDGQGGAFLAWYEWPTYDVYAQHVLGNGQIALGWPANGLPISVKPGYQDSPRLVPDDAGGVYIAWQDGDFDVPGDIYAQHINGDGTKAAGWPDSGLAVCTDPGNQGSPYLASDSHGGFFVIWGDLRNGPTAIYGTRVTQTGAIAPGWPLNGRQVAGGTLNYGLRGIVPDGAGGAYIAWEITVGPPFDDNDVYAVRILADGSIAPGWPSGGLVVAAQPGPQYLNSVVADGSGGVLLAWSDQNQQPAVAYVQRLRPDGTTAPGWPAGGARVSDLASWQLEPVLAPAGDGGAFVVLELDTDSGQKGYLQHFAAGGAPAPGWPASAVSLVYPTVFFAFQQTEFAITSDGAGGAIVAWNDTRVMNGQVFSNQIYAQRYFGDGPTPALVALVSAEALPDRVALTWYDPGRTLSLATVYRRRDGEAWRALGRASFDGSGRLQYEDRDVAPGAHYAYRLGWSESGAEQYSAESWVDVPVALTLALEGARPNPSVGPLDVAFTLPRAEPATLALLDVSGRQVLSREVGSLGAGRHRLRFGECGCTPPGRYWLRLAQAGRTLVKRAAIVR